MQKLDGHAPRNIGLVPPAVTGLPTDLWRKSDSAQIAELLSQLGLPNLPAAQTLLYTVLLAETAAPNGGDAAQDALGLARVETLVRLGALDPAESLIEQVGTSKSPAHFDLWMDISLLVGTEHRPCAALMRAPHLTHDYDRKIFCAAREGAYDNAALTFGSAQALGFLPQEKLDLLDRFLHPDLFEDADPLQVPRQMDPLTFRLFETIGEPLPSSNLERAYAVADLRDLAGWKAQLHAAERLTRSGALPDNRLLGLYTDREPAASGGIWDRVEALQRFETALGTSSPEAISKTLPAVWREMKAAELEVAFANLFAHRLGSLDLSAAAARAAFEIKILSPAYETAAADATAASTHPQAAALAALARGEMPVGPIDEPRAQAIFAGFAEDAKGRAPLVAMAQDGQLGAAIVQTLLLLQDGANGDLLALSDALATLRALGLEDTARRAALQAMLLERHS
ncbi:MAG: hypothetical protein ACSHWZ_07745 [Sulfitobacter sp.]